MRAYVHWRRVSAADDPRAYLRRILVRCALDAARRPSRREVPTEVLAAPAVADGTTTRAEADRVARALQVLAPPASASAWCCASSRTSTWQNGRAARDPVGNREEQHAPGGRDATQDIGRERFRGAPGGREDDVSSSEEQVLTSLRSAVARRPGRFRAVGRRRSAGGRRRSRGDAACRRWERRPRPPSLVAVGRAAGPARPARAGDPGTATTAPQNDVRRLYAAYDSAVSRAGLPVLDTRSTVPAVRRGWGRPRRVPGLRRVAVAAPTSGPGSSFDFQTVELEASPAPTTQDGCAVPTWPTGQVRHGNPARGSPLLRCSSTIPTGPSRDHAAGTRPVSWSSAAPRQRRRARSPTSSCSSSPRTPPCAGDGGQKPRRAGRLRPLALLVQDRSHGGLLGEPVAAARSPVTSPPSCAISTSAGVHALQDVVDHAVLRLEPVDDRCEPGVCAAQVRQHRLVLQRVVPGDHATVRTGGQAPRVHAFCRIVHLVDVPAGVPASTRPDAPGRPGTAPGRARRAACRARRRGAARRPSRGRCTRGPGRDAGRTGRVDSSQGLSGCSARSVVGRRTTPKVERRTAAATVVGSATTAGVCTGASADAARSGRARAASTVSRTSSATTATRRMASGSSTEGGRAAHPLLEAGRRAASASNEG